MDQVIKLIIFGILLISCVFVRPCASQLSRLSQRGQRGPRGLMGAVGRIQQQRCNMCPPPWIPMLEQFRSYLVPRVMNRVCPIALRSGFIAPCGNPGGRCGTNAGRVPTRFCCCPAERVSKVAECVQGSRNVCVPEDFRPWQNELQGVIMSSVMG